MPEFHGTRRFISYTTIGLWAIGLSVDIFLIAATQTANFAGCALEAANCNAVLMSPASRVGGISLSIWGLVFYLILGMLFLLKQRLHAPLGDLLLATGMIPGVTAAVWLTSVMRNRIGQYCPWCLVLHGVNLLLFLFSSYSAQRAWEAGQARRKANSRPPLPQRIVFCFIGAGVLIAVWGLSLFVVLGGQAEAVVRPIFGIPNPVIASRLDDVSQTLTILGKQAGKRRIVLITCPTCSHCRHAWKILQAVILENPGIYQIDVRFAPLSSECNPEIGSGQELNPSHSAACSLSRLAIAVCRSNPEEFAPYMDWLFENQNALTEHQARTEAERRVGTKFLNREMKSDAVEGRLQQDIRLSSQLKISSLPAILVPSGLIDGVLTIARLQKLFDMEFRSAG
jgi:uncharacterized membrane protein/protein-disulfide isomerase